MFDGTTSMRRPAPGRARTMRPALWLVLFIATAVVGPPTVEAQGLTDLFMSRESEKQIGAEQHEYIVAEFGGVYEDRDLAAYVDSIGQFLARTSNAPDVGYTFTILNSPVINAFALPGGYVYVTRGLIGLAENEAELAGVIAHEIGHVAARHGAQRHSKNVLTGIGLTILGIATESSALTNIASVGAQAVLSSYSREDEFEADQLGVGYLSRAGFDTDSMSTFLSKMEDNTRLEAKIQGEQYNGDIGFFASHPRTADRVARAVELSLGNRVDRPILGTETFLDKIDGMIYGDDPKQGLIEGQRFIHPDLGFEFTVPPEFSITNQPAQVIARDREGAVIKFDGSAGYRGPMTAYLQRNWPRDLPSPSTQSLQINGMDGATAAATVRGQRGPVDIRMVAISYSDEYVFRFMFMSPQHLTRDLNVEFRRTTYSFKRMNQREIHSIRPRIISLHTVQRGDTIDSLSARMSDPEFARERFMLINGLTDGGTLPVGKTVKLVTRR